MNAEESAAYHRGVVLGWKLALIEYAGETPEYADSEESKEMLVEATKKYQ